MEFWTVFTTSIVKLQGKTLCVAYGSVYFLNSGLVLHAFNIFSKKYCYNSLFLLKNTEDRYKDVHKL